MSDLFLPTTIRELRRLKRLAEAAVDQLDDAQFVAVPGADGNSPAIVLKHMAGNMISRWTDFLTTDGEKPDRNRDSEFELDDAEDRAAVLARWERGWSVLFGALEPLTTADLARTVTIRGEPHSVLDAVQRQLSHYAYHVGQVVLMAKSLRGPAWRTLSVAKGKSREFNAAPAPYLAPGGGR